MISKLFQTRKFQISIAVVITLLITTSFLFSKKTIAVIFNGEVSDLQTRALTVGGAVAELGISLGDGIRVEPAPNTFLRNPQVIQIQSTREVHISDGDDEVVIYTFSQSPAQIFVEAEIEINADTLVYYQGLQILDFEETLPASQYYEFQLRSSNTLVLDFGEGLVSFATHAKTLGEALSETGNPLHVGDQVSLPLDTPLETDLTVEVVRSRLITIQTAQGALEALVNADTVGEALAQSGISLQGADYAEPDVIEPIPSDGKITVYRVSEDLVLDQKLLPFTTVFQPVPDLEIDNQTFVQAGEYGVESQRVRVKYVDGVEADRTVEAAWIAREPVNRIEGYGTQINIRTVNTGEGVIEYWRSIQVYATSYSASRSGTDPNAPWFGKTYSGKPLEFGHIAVIPAWWSSMAGSAVYVSGYGYGTIEDIGSGFSDRDWIDLGYPDDAYVGWSEYVTLYFLTPVPPESQILWVLP